MKNIILLFVFNLLGLGLFAQSSGNEALSNLPKASELKQTKAKATSRNTVQRKYQKNDEVAIGQYDAETSQEGVRARMDGRPSPMERKIISRLINEREVAPTE